VFKGTYRHRIDPKGRIPVPASFRRVLQPEADGRLVVTVLDLCLAVYPPHEWEQLETQLRALPAFRKPVKALTRLLTSRAADCQVDTQGRILLPSVLRGAAGLKNEAVVVGVLNRFEVWSPEAWTGFLDESERLLDDASIDLQWPPPPSAGPPRPQAKPKR
jgi:MraZ protein